MSRRRAIPIVPVPIEPMVIEPARPVPSIPSVPVDLGVAPSVPSPAPSAAPPVEPPPTPPAVAPIAPSPALPPAPPLQTETRFVVPEPIRPADGYAASVPVTDPNAESYQKFINALEEVLRPYIEKNIWLNLKPIERLFPGQSPFSAAGEQDESTRLKRSPMQHLFNVKRYLNVDGWNRKEREDSRRGPEVRFGGVEQLIDWLYDTNNRSFSDPSQVREINEAHRLLYDHLLQNVPSGVLGFQAPLDQMRKIVHEIVDSANAAGVAIGAPVELIPWIWDSYYRKVEEALRSKDSEAINAVAQQAPAYLLLNDLVEVINIDHNQYQSREMTRVVKEFLASGAGTRGQEGGTIPVAVITAPAGAGKTTTLIRGITQALQESAKRGGQDERIGFYVFNRDLQNEMFGKIVRALTEAFATSGAPRGPQASAVIDRIDIRTIDSMAHRIARSSLMGKIVGGLSRDAIKSMITGARYAIAQAFFQAYPDQRISNIDYRSNLERIAKFYREKPELEIGYQVIRKESASVLPPLPLIREIRRGLQISKQGGRLEPQTVQMLRVIGLAAEADEEGTIHRWVYHKDYEDKVRVEIQERLKRYDRLSRRLEHPAFQNILKVYYWLAERLALRLLQRLAELVLTAIDPSQIGDEPLADVIDRFMRLPVREVLQRYRERLTEHFRYTKSELDDVLSNDPLYQILNQHASLSLQKFWSLWFDRSVSVGSFWSYVILAFVLRDRDENDLESGVVDPADLIDAIDPSYGYGVNHLILAAYAADRSERVDPGAANVAGLGGVDQRVPRVFVIDEAQDASSPVVLYLMRAAQDGRGRLLMVLDPNQQMNRHAGYTYLGHWFQRAPLWLHRLYGVEPEENVFLSTFFRTPGYHVARVGARLYRILDQYAARLLAAVSPAQLPVEREVTGARTIHYEEHNRVLALALDERGGRRRVANRAVLQIELEWVERAGGMLTGHQKRVTLQLTHGYPIETDTTREVLVRLYPHPIYHRTVIDADGRPHSVPTPVDYNDAESVEALRESIRSGQPITFALGYEVLFRHVERPKSTHRGPTATAETVRRSYRSGVLRDSQGLPIAYNANTLNDSAVALEATLGAALLEILNDLIKEGVPSRNVRYQIDASPIPAPVHVDDPPIVAVPEYLSARKSQDYVYQFRVGKEYKYALRREVQNFNERVVVGSESKTIDLSLTELMYQALQTTRTQGQSITEDLFKQLITYHVGHYLRTVEPEVQMMVFYASETPARSGYDPNLPIRRINPEHAVLDEAFYHNTERQLHRLANFLNPKHQGGHEKETALPYLLRIPQVHQRMQTFYELWGLGPYRPVQITMTNAAEYLLPFLHAVVDPTMWRVGVNIHRSVKGATYSAVVNALPLDPYRYDQPPEYVAATRSESFDPQRRFDPARQIPIALMSPRLEWFATLPEYKKQIYAQLRPLGQSGVTGFPASIGRDRTHAVRMLHRYPYFTATAQDQFPYRDPQGRLHLPAIVSFEADTNAILDWIARNKVWSGATDLLAFWRALHSLAHATSNLSITMDRKALGKRYKRTVVTPLRNYLTEVSNITARHSTIQVRVVSTLGRLMEKVVRTDRLRVAEPVLLAGLVHLWVEPNEKLRVRFDARALYGSYTNYRQPDKPLVAETVLYGERTQSDGSSGPSVGVYRHLIANNLVGQLEDYRNVQEDPVMGAYLFHDGEKVRFRNRVYPEVQQEIDLMVRAGLDGAAVLEQLRAIARDPNRYDESYPNLAALVRWLGGLRIEYQEGESWVAYPIEDLLIETVLPRGLISVPKDEFQLYTRLGEVQTFEDRLAEMIDTENLVSDEETVKSLIRIAELVEEDSVWSYGSKVRPTVALVHFPFRRRNTGGFQGEETESYERLKELFDQYWSETRGIAVGSGPIKEIHDVVEMEYAMMHSSSVGSHAPGLGQYRFADGVKLALPRVGVPFSSVLASESLFELVVAALPEEERAAARAEYDRVREWTRYHTRAMGVADPMLFVLTSFYDAIAAYDQNDEYAKSFHDAYTERDDGSLDALDFDTLLLRLAELVPEPIRPWVQNAVVTRHASEDDPVRALWSLYRRLSSREWTAYLARYPFLFPSSALVVPAVVVRHPTVVVPNPYYWALNGDADGDRLVARLIEPIPSDSVVPDEYRTMFYRLAHMAVYNPIESEADAALNMTPLAEGHATHAAFMSVVWGTAIDAYDDLLGLPDQPMVLDLKQRQWQVDQETIRDLAQLRRYLIEQGLGEENGRLVFRTEPLWRFYRRKVVVRFGEDTITLRGSAAWLVWAVFEGFREAGATDEELQALWELLVARAPSIQDTGWDRETLADWMVTFAEQADPNERIRRLSLWHGLWATVDRPDQAAVLMTDLDGGNTYEGDTVVKKGKVGMTRAMRERLEALRLKQRIPAGHVLTDPAVRDEFAVVNALLDHAFRSLHGYQPATQDTYRWLGWAYADKNRWYGYRYRVKDPKGTTLQIERVPLGEATGFEPRLSADGASYQIPAWAEGAGNPEVVVIDGTDTFGYDWLKDRATPSTDTLPDWTRQELRLSLWPDMDDWSVRSVGLRALTMLTRYLLYRTMQAMVAQAAFDPGLRAILENNPYESSSFNTKRITALLEARLPGTWVSYGDPQVGFLWAPTPSNELRPLAFQNAALARNPYAFTTNYDVESGGLMSKAIQAAGFLVDPKLEVPDDAPRETVGPVRFMDWARRSVKAAYRLVISQGDRRYEIPFWRRSSMRMVAAQLTREGFDLNQPVTIEYVPVRAAMVEVTPATPVRTRMFPLYGVPALTYIGTDVLVDHRQALVPHAESNKLTQVYIDLFKRLGLSTVFSAEYDNPEFAVYALSAVGVLREAKPDSRTPGNMINPTQPVPHYTQAFFLRSTDPNRAAPSYDRDAFTMLGFGIDQPFVTGATFLVRGGFPLLFAPIVLPRFDLAWSVDSRAVLMAWAKALIGSPRRFETAILPDRREDYLIALAPNLLLHPFQEAQSFQGRVSPLRRPETELLERIKGSIEGIVAAAVEFVHALRGTGKVTLVLLRDTGLTDPVEQTRYLETVKEYYEDFFKGLENEYRGREVKFEFVDDPAKVAYEQDLVDAYDRIHRDVAVATREYHYSRDRKISAMVGALADLHLVYYGAAVTPLDEVGAWMGYRIAPLGFSGIGTPVAVFETDFYRPSTQARYARHALLGWLSQRLGLAKIDGRVPLVEWLKPIDAVVDAALAARIGTDNPLDVETVRRLAVLAGLDPTSRAALIQMDGYYHPSRIRDMQTGLSGGEPSKYFAPERSARTWKKANAFEPSDLGTLPSVQKHLFWPVQHFYSVEAHAPETPLITIPRDQFTKYVITNPETKTIHPAIDRSALAVVVIRGKGGYLKAGDYYYGTSVEDRNAARMLERYGPTTVAQRDQRTWEIRVPLGDSDRTNAQWYESETRIALDTIEPNEKRFKEAVAEAKRLPSDFEIREGLRHRRIVRITTKHDWVANLIHVFIDAVLRESAGVDEFVFVVERSSWSQSRFSV